MNAPATTTPRGDHGPAASAPPTGGHGTAGADDAALSALVRHVLGDATLGTHASVRVPGRVRLDGRDPRAVPVLGLLREASALAATVDWAADVPADLPLWTLTHLPPPREATGVDPSDLERWRDRYDYGRCYYRRGPGFLVVHDARREPPVRRVLAEAGTADALDALRLPRSVGALPPPVGAALPELYRLGLVIRLGEQVMALPWRPRQWPVPCTL